MMPAKRLAPAQGRAVAQKSSAGRTTIAPAGAKPAAPRPCGPRPGGLPFARVPVEDRIFGPQLADQYGLPMITFCTLAAEHRYPALLRFKPNGWCWSRREVEAWVAEHGAPRPSARRTYVRK